MMNLTSILHHGRTAIHPWEHFKTKSILGMVLSLHTYIQGVPKKVSVKPTLEFENLGGVFLGVKNNSKNFLFYETFWVV